MQQRINKTKYIFTYISQIDFHVMDILNNPRKNYNDFYTTKEWQIQSLVLTLMLSHTSKPQLQSCQQMWQGKTYNCDYTFAKIITNFHGDIPLHANLPYKSFLRYVEYIPSLAGMNFPSFDAQNSSLGAPKPTLMHSSILVFIALHFLCCFGWEKLEHVTTMFKFTYLLTNLPHN